MKYIPLTQGKRAIVDDEDFEMLNQWKWLAQKQTGGMFRAMRNVWNKENGNCDSYYMHRVVMGVGHGEKVDVDHKNHDPLDNRKENLRVCSHHQNCMNVGVRSDSLAGFKGVSLNKQKTKWRARLSAAGKEIFLGHYETPEEAAMAYNVAARIVYGEFAYLNNTY